MAPTRHDPTAVPYDEPAQTAVMTDPIDRLWRLRLFCGMIDLNPIVFLGSGGAVAALIWYACTDAFVAEEMAEWVEWINDEW